MVVLTDFCYDKQETVIGDMTPYHGDYGDPFAYGTSNYDNYDIFCFNSKFGEKLRRLNPDLSHCLIPVDVQKKVYLGVQLLYGAEYIESNDEEVIRQMIKQAHTECDGKFVFMSTYFDLYYQGVLIPKLWLQLVLPKVQLLQNVSYQSGEVFDLDFEIHEGALYMGLLRNTDYQKDYMDIKFLVFDYLLSLYVAGTIALPADSQIPQRWRLRQIAPELYSSDWFNAHFARDKSDFLLRLALGSQSITLHVPEESREQITEKVKQKHFFIEDRVVINVGGLNEALRLTKRIWKIVNTL